MGRFASFMIGFIVALGLLAALALGPMRHAGLLTLLPTTSGPTPALDVSQVIQAPPAAPSTNVQAAVDDRILVWERQHASTLACDHLSIDSGQELHHGPCAGSQSLSTLSHYETNLLQFYLMRYEPFTYSAREEVRTVRETTILLTFHGTGNTQASLSTQAEIAAWITAVYERLATEEEQNALIARCRTHLARQLAVGIQDVRLLEIVPVRWPDACLGLHSPGVFCAQVVTPGYRLKFSAANREFECRTDEHGQVRSTEGHSGAYRLPALGE